VVIVLRSYLDLSQAEIGEVCGVSQSEVSKYELGAVPLPEPVLRRMLERARIDGSLVVLLRRFFAHWISAADRRGARAAEPPGLEMFEPALLAVMPYLIEEGEAGVNGKRLEEAEEI
jgi:transcriptional regulator with XRE-family HTH domain